MFIFPNILFFIPALVSGKRKAYHNMLAGTMVIESPPFATLTRS